MSDMSDDGLAPGAASVNQPAAEPRPAGQKIVLGVVIFLGVLIVLGTGALVVGVAMKFRGGGHASSAGVAAQSLMLQPGSKIEAMQVSGDRMVLRVATAAGEEIDIVDLKDGHVVSRIRTAPPEIPR